MEGFFIGNEAMLYWQWRGRPLAMEHHGMPIIMDYYAE